MIFEGQKRFEQILKETKCPRSIHEIHFFLRGLLAGTEVSPPSAWFGWLFEGSEPVFESEEQAQKLMGNVMGLWNQIASAQQGDMPFPDIEGKFPETLEGVLARIKTINLKTNAFIKGLDFAGTDPMEMTPDGRQAMEDLTKDEVLCTKYVELAKTKKVAPKGMHATLDHMEAIMEDCILRITVSLNEARKVAVARKQAPAQSERIERNAPCPCGSGKKYKKCCWLKVH